MKNFILFIILSFWAFAVSANPIMLPYIQINELYFEEDEWIIELAYYEANQVDFPIMNILLSSSSTEAELLTFEISGESGLILIDSNSDFSGQCIINPEGDMLNLTWSISEGSELFYQETEFYFGDYPEAVVTKPYPGQSIALIGATHYSKDNSPSLGLMNDTTGAMGTLYGTIFDINLQPVPEETFQLMVPTSIINRFTTLIDGQYSVRAISNIYNSTTIFHDIPNQNHEIVNAEIHYIMEPDTALNYDIYLLDNLTVGILSPKGSSGDIFRFYPNPVTQELSLKYDIGIPTNNQNLTIEVKSILSVSNFIYPVSQHEGTLKLPEQISSGVYVVNLVSGHKILSSGRLVVKK